MPSTLSNKKRQAHPRRARRSGTSRTVKRYSVQEIEKLRALILTLRNETLEEIDNLKESIEEKDEEQAVHSLHDATSGNQLPDTSIYEYSRELRLVKVLDEALERIERHEYGMCRKCGALVEKMRLLAIPHARLCFHCKDLHEHTPHTAR